MVQDVQKFRCSAHREKVDEDADEIGELQGKSSLWRKMKICMT